MNDVVWKFSGVKMRLVFPNMQYKEKAIDFIQEFYDNNSDINGSGGLDGYLEDSTYEEWIKKVLADIVFDQPKGKNITQPICFLMH